jgi:hypothetical protein
MDRDLTYEIPTFCACFQGLALIFGPPPLKATILKLG